MRSGLSAVAGIALLSCSSNAPPPAPRPNLGPGPIVIELYQSQGCSSCPPANAALNDIAGNPAVIALSFAVTYWDKFGWKDKFAAPQFTQRQLDYAHARGTGRVFTPQFVINGKDAGSNSNALWQLARQAGAARGGPSIERAGDSITIGQAKAAKPATVWLVTYDPRVRTVPVRRGENMGRTLPHRNIVTMLKPLGTWTGPVKQFPLAGPSGPGLRRAVLVQSGSGGPIIAARKI